MNILEKTLGVCVLSLTFGGCANNPYNPVPYNRGYGVGTPAVRQIEGMGDRTVRQIESGVQRGIDAKAREATNGLLRNILGR